MNDIIISNDRKFDAQTMLEDLIAVRKQLIDNNSDHWLSAGLEILKITEKYAPELQIYWRPTGE